MGPAQFSSARQWLAAHVGGVLLVLTGGCLVVGSLFHLAGGTGAGDMAWVAGGIVGTAFSLWTMLTSLRRGRLGVDVIALLALVGALAVGEYLAAAVLSVMVASGQALEGWAAGRLGGPAGTCVPCCCGPRASPNIMTVTPWRWSRW